MDTNKALAAFVILGVTNLCISIVALCNRSKPQEVVIVEPENEEE